MSSAELPGYATPVRRSTVGGVPVFSAAADGDVSAALVVRVGRIDERLTSSGITHLVEHLAMPMHGRHVFDANASVDIVRTVFWAHGTENEVAGFLRHVCAALRDLPLERLDAERRILKAEEAKADTTAYAVLAGARFGARGAGLVNWGEPALDRLKPDDVAAWAATRFTAANAAAWTTGAAEALELDLPAGHRILPPRPEQNRLVAPAYLDWGSGGVAFSATTSRTVAARAAAELLRDRLFHVLRYELGVSYGVNIGYEPLTADLAYVFLVADALPENEAQALEQTLATLEAFAHDGPTEEELERYRTTMRRSLLDATQARGWLDSLATSQLLGEPLESNDSLLAAADDLVPTDVAAAAAELLDDVLFCVPEGIPVPPSLRSVPEPSEPPVEGRRFTPRYQIHGRPNLTVVAGPDGVSLTDPKGTLTMRVEDAAGMFRWQNRRRLIVRSDGRTLTLSDGVFWRGGRELLRLIDRTYPQALWLDVDEELPVPKRRRISYIVLVPVGIFTGGMLSAAVQGLGASDNVGAAAAVLWLAGLIGWRFGSEQLEKR